MDPLTNLENVNNEVQKAGAGDKRNRNEAIRKGLENPGLYQTTGVQPNGLDQTLSSLGSQPSWQESQQSSWQAPQVWADRLWDSAQTPTTSSTHNWETGEDTWNTQTANDISIATGNKNALYDTSKEALYKRINEESQAYRNKGFIPGASGNGWNWNPGISAPGIGEHNEDALREEGGGYWEKNNPSAYKGQGSDYIWYSPSRGYQTSQYLKKAPKEHGVSGFLKSPGGAVLMGLLGAGLGAGGLGGLFGAAEGSAVGGLSSLEGALGAAGGMSVAPGVASSGLIGSLGLSPAMSLVPGGAAMAGVASGALGSGGLFGNGGVFGSGIDLGKLGNSAIESGIKSTLTSGGDIKKGLTSGLTQGLGNGLGGLFNNDISKYISSISKPLIGNALSGGDFQAGLKNALFGGASAGLGDMLNSTDLMSGNTQEKNALANNVTSLAQTLSRKRKVA